MSQCSKWKYDLDQQEWVTFLELTNQIEDFIFFRPANEEVNAALPSLEKDRKMLTKKSKSMTTAPIRQESLHLNIFSCTCDDLELAEAIVRCFEKLDIGKDSNKVRTYAEI